MTDKERLIELLDDKQVYGIEPCLDEYAMPCVDNEVIADYLIQNGLAFSTESKAATRYSAPYNVGEVVYDQNAEPFKIISIEWFASGIPYLHCISTTTGKKHTFAVGKKSVGKTIFHTLEEVLYKEKK